MIAETRTQSFARDGLRFRVAEWGPRDGPVVVLLHGFPETSSSFEAVGRGLAEAGCRVLAPDQRGYSPQARPTDRRAYRRAELVADVIAIAEQAGAGRFHLAGHDWGAAVAWAVAMEYPDRVRTLTSLSIPHPAAFRRAALSSGQGLRSWYMAFLQIPGLPEALIRTRNWRSFRRSLLRTGLPAVFADRYIEHLQEPGALQGAIAWYRGMRPFADSRPVRVTVPTLLIWGDRDAYVHPKGVHGTAQLVSGPYRLEVLRGVSHWIPEEVPHRVVELMRAHLSSAHAG